MPVSNATAPASQAAHKHHMHHLLEYQADLHGGAGASALGDAPLRLVVRCVASLGTCWIVMQRICGALLVSVQLSNWTDTQLCASRGLPAGRVAVEVAAPRSRTSRHMHAHRGTVPIASAQLSLKFAAATALLQRPTGRRMLGSCTPSGLAWR